MKIYQGLCLLALFFYQNTYAEEALSAPSGQSPQCEKAYESAGQIKTIGNVFNTLSSACHDAGGMKLMHQILVSENGNEPTGVLFTCTGSDSNYVVLSCLFPTSLES
ncbi:Uncharacterised protein [Legionella wadsworthii]|uniref:Uncharacterized protein n=1 Tax=Legionella wadsworthii TaxID=28088 RepID=A0A378LUN7_9GAMM|nr:hypothetical protein [Legionella wadsworthii]STY29542.1 Uncharacterised protein [Legionella wadsworthii]